MTDTGNTDLTYIQFPLTNEWCALNLFRIHDTTLNKVWAVASPVSSNSFIITLQDPVVFYSTLEISFQQQLFFFDTNTLALKNYWIFLQPGGTDLICAPDIFSGNPIDYTVQYTVNAALPQGLAGGFNVGYQPASGSVGNQNVYFNTLNRIRWYANNHGNQYNVILVPQTVTNPPQSYTQVMVFFFDINHLNYQLESTDNLIMEGIPYDTYSLTNQLTLTEQQQYNGVPVDFVGYNYNNSLYMTISNLSDLATVTVSQSNLLSPQEQFNLEFLTANTFFIKQTIYSNNQFVGFFYIYVDLTTFTLQGTNNLTLLSNRFTDTRFQWTRQNAPFANNLSPSVPPRTLELWWDSQVISVSTLTNPPITWIQNSNFGGQSLTYSQQLHNSLLTNIGSGLSVSFQDGSLVNAGPPNFWYLSTQLHMSVQFSTFTSGLISEFLTQTQLNDFSTCCTTNSGNAYCDLTTLVPGTFSCDTYISNLCNFQTFTGCLDACSCWTPPPSGYNTSIIPDQFDLCFLPACWSVSGYTTVLMASSNTCPQYVCQEAVNQVLRAIFYRSFTTSDCSNLGITTITTSVNALYGLFSLTGTDTITGGPTNENSNIKPPPISNVTLTANLQGTNVVAANTTITVTQPPPETVSLAMYISYAVIGVLLFLLVLFLYKQKRDDQQRAIHAFK